MPTYSVVWDKKKGGKYVGGLPAEKKFTSLAKAAKFAKKQRGCGAWVVKGSRRIPPKQLAKYTKPTRKRRTRKSSPFSLF